MKKQLAVILMLLVGVGAMAYAQSSQQTPAKNGKKYVATKEIIFDKATSTLRKPTEEETNALVSYLTVQLNRSTADLPVTQLANGGKMMSLEERFGGVLLGRAQADGTTEVRCVTTFEEALDFLGLEESTPQQ